MNTVLRFGETLVVSVTLARGRLLGPLEPPLTDDCGELSGS